MNLGVDELDVEWCVKCGKEKDRMAMELKEVKLDILEQGKERVQGKLGNMGSRSVNGRVTGVGDEKGDVGVWWVCRWGCEGPSTP